MADLHHSGPIVTLPFLCAHAGAMEFDLARWTSPRPLALLLPCHVRELNTPALVQIRNMLAPVTWLSRVIVGLDGADRTSYAAARVFFPAAWEVLHHQGTTGKGGNLQRMVEHILANDPPYAVAINDCDVSTYSLEFLARLCWPILHPAAGFRYCKGSYARHTDRLHGRVFRLLLQPLLAAMDEIQGFDPARDFVRAFRYPLAGEMCFTTELLAGIPFESGWGVEMQLLRAVYDRTKPHEVCQAELCSAYDHRHHDLSPHDPTSGLHRTAIEVTAATLKYFGGEHIKKSALLAAWDRHAASAVHRSSLICEINGLIHDSTAEALAVKTFRRSLE